MWPIRLPTSSLLSSALRALHVLGRPINVGTSGRGLRNRCLRRLGHGRSPSDRVCHGCLRHRTRADVLGYLRCRFGPEDRHDAGAAKADVQTHRLRRGLGSPRVLDCRSIARCRDGVLGVGTLCAGFRIGDGADLLRGGGVIGASPCGGRRSSLLVRAVGAVRAGAIAAGATLRRGRRRAPAPRHAGVYRRVTESLG